MRYQGNILLSAGGDHALTHLLDSSEAEARLGIILAPPASAAVPSPPPSAACMAPRFFHAFSRKRSPKPAAAAGASEEEEGGGGALCGPAAGAEPEAAIDPDPDVSDPNAGSEEGCDGAAPAAAGPPLPPPLPSPLCPRVCCSTACVDPAGPCGPKAVTEAEAESGLIVLGWACWPEKC